MRSETPIRLPSLSLVALGAILLFLLSAWPVAGQNVSSQPPELQPRAYLAVDLRAGDAAVDGLDATALKARGLTRGPSGLELTTTEADGLRVASVELDATLDFPANAISVLWRDRRPAGTAIEIEVIVSPDGETWSRPYGVHPDPHGPDEIRKRLGDGTPNPNHGFTPGNLLSFGLERFRFLRYRITLISESSATPSLEALRFFYQDSTLGQRPGDARPDHETKAGGYGQPTICDRACWSARAPQCSISQMSSIGRAVIHHTASQTSWNTTSQAESEANVRALQNFHMDSRGWCDVGYHFLVDKLGHRFEGRQGSVSSRPRGAHDGVNSNSIGVSLMGYLHSPYNQVPPTAMRDAAYDLIAWKVQDPFDGYGSSSYGGGIVGFLAGHRDVASTACPGDQMYAYIGTDFFAGDARDGVNGRVTGGSIPCCPDTPTLRSAVSGSGAVTVSWLDVGLVDHYNVYGSDDGVVFDAPVSVPTGTTTYTETGLSAGEVRYYRVSAVGSSQESAFSDVYGAVAGGSAEVLIVDGNDRWPFQSSENPSGANHGFAAVTGEAVAPTRFDTADNDAVEDGSIALGGYDAVVWMLGEESTAQVTFSAAEQSAVAAYLGAGGNLFVSGAEIGWDLVAQGGTADQAFFGDWLKAAYLGDDAGTYSVQPEAGGLFDGLGSLSFAGGVMNVAYPDELGVSGGSLGELRYATGDLAAISYDGTFRLVHFGFPFETLDNAGDRAAVMDRALDFLLASSSGCTVQEDFEAGAAGWYISGASTCATGDYVLGNPTLVTNSGVTTQVGGSYSGTYSVFTAANSSAGVDDVDGGNCILGSPVWSVPQSSTLSVAWWHGQRDSGDDPSGDFFRLEYSLNGGTSWTTLRSNGDSLQNATWSVATAAIPAGSNVTLRVQCSDGTAAGDLVECGIDDVTLCH